MDNQTKIKGLELKAIYYYRRTAHGVITTCLLVSKSAVVARGRSLCSPKDQFVKVTGRHKALGMAYQAMLMGEKAKAHKVPLIAEDLVPLKIGKPLLGYKGIYLPALDGFEMKISGLLAR